MIRRAIAYLRVEVYDAHTAFQMREWVYMLPTPLFRVVMRHRKNTAEVYATHHPHA